MNTPIRHEHQTFSFCSSRYTFAKIFYLVSLNMIRVVSSNPRWFTIERYQWGKLSRQPNEYQFPQNDSEPCLQFLLSSKNWSIEYAKYYRLGKGSGNSLLKSTSLERNLDGCSAQSTSLVLSPECYTALPNRMVMLFRQTRTSSETARPKNAHAFVDQLSIDCYSDSK